MLYGAFWNRPSANSTYASHMHPGIVTRLTAGGLAVVLSLPGAAYVVGLARVHGMPVPADPAHYSSEVIAATWARCREKTPIAVQAMSPWSFGNKFMFADPLETTPGERAAWRIASTHNSKYRRSGMLWWHTSGAALSIWVTRHWSAEQIGATLVRDNLCK
nr:putative integron gene cassette protein [uncultured bacterium]